MLYAASTEASLAERRRREMWLVGQIGRESVDKDSSPRKVGCDWCRWKTDSGSGARLRSVGGEEDEGRLDVEIPACR